MIYGPALPALPPPSKASYVKTLQFTPDELVSSAYHHAEDFTARRRGTRSCQQRNVVNWPRMVLQMQQ